MNKKNLALVPLALVAVGCARPPTPPVGPWGYAFTQGTFTDQRGEADDTRLMEATPFRMSNFMQAWDATVARTPVLSEPALLDVTLTHYEATHSGDSFSISLEATLQARKPDGTVIARQPAACAVVERRFLGGVGDFAQQAFHQQSLTPLTEEARDATMWQKVWTSCVRTLATSFGNTLASVPGGATPLPH